MEMKKTNSYGDVFVWCVVKASTDTRHLQSYRQVYITLLYRQTQESVVLNIRCLTVKSKQATAQIWLEAVIM